MNRVLLVLVALIGLLASSEASAQSTTSGGFSCRRLTGLAIGAVHAPGSWDRLGRSPTFVSWSPVVAGACAIDVGPVSMFGGSEIQFMYHHYDATKDLTRGWVTLTSGATFGTDELRAGAHAMAGLAPNGLYPTGAGASLLWLPGNPRGTRDGLEARLTGYWVAHPNVQLMVLYVVNSPRIP